MKVLLLGASGLTGRQVLAQAVQEGHAVTVLVRDPGQLERVDQQTGVHVGSVMDPTVVDSLVAGQDAVLSTLGTRRSPRGLGSVRLMSRSLQALVPAMERHAVGRLIILSALGVGETAATAPRAFRLVFQTILRPVGRDKALSEECVRRSALNWTLVYAPVLTNGPMTGTYRHGDRLDVRGLAKISRADVAQFMLAQLSDTHYSRRSVIVSS